MGKLIKVRNLVTGRDDEYKVEVVDLDGTRTELEMATAAEVTAGTNTTKIAAPAAISGATLTGTVAAASATVAGKVELATDEEAGTGTDTTRAITPANLKAAATTHVSAASETVAGKVELATNVETIAVTDQTRAVTPYGLGAAIAKLYAISFTGKNGAGACTLTGAKVTDIVLSVTGLTDMGDASSSFEGAITVADQIQQSAAGDLSTKNFLALIYGLA